MPIITPNKGLWLNLILAIFVSITNMTNIQKVMPFSKLFPKHCCICNRQMIAHIIDDQTQFKQIEFLCLAYFDQLVEAIE